MSQKPRHWLMKAEPDSRVVKGKDVKVKFELSLNTLVAHLDGLVSPRYF